MELFSISKELAIAIGNYLSTKPWSEVNQLISELQKITPIQTAKIEEKQQECGINAEGGNE